MSNNSINQNNKRYITLILFFAALFAVLTLYPSGSPAAAPSNPSPPTADDFRSIPLKDVEGNDIYIRDYEGKVLLLEYMATWCLTCAQMEPILKDFWSKYESQNVEMLAVSVDPTFDTPDVIKNHIIKKDIPWVITRDTTLMLMNYFKVTDLSTVMIISPEGEVVETYKGLVNLETLSEVVDNLL